jgi:hypothetical protein
MWVGHVGRRDAETTDPGCAGCGRRCHGIASGRQGVPGNRDEQPPVGRRLWSARDENAFFHRRMSAAAIHFNDNLYVGRISCAEPIGARIGSRKACFTGTAKLAVGVGGDRARNLRSMDEIWKKSIRTVGKTHTSVNSSNDLEYGEIPGKLRGRARKPRKKQSQIDLGPTAKTVNARIDGTKRRIRTSLKRTAGISPVPEGPDTGLPPGEAGPCHFSEA